MPVHSSVQGREVAQMTLTSSSPPLLLLPFIYVSMNENSKKNMFEFVRPQPSVVLSRLNGCWCSTQRFSICIHCSHYCYFCTLSYSNYLDMSIKCHVITLSIIFGKDSVDERSKLKLQRLRYPIYIS